MAHIILKLQEPVYGFKQWLISNQATTKWLAKDDYQSFPPF